ncbi:coronin-like protein crn1 [Acrodontium crateriforme]|uniref:Coronin n=1 Tax=Acrodontium crateriforme TaxID=150365 RepID=A0AAQ3M6V6_9PEZI|nr:coronin-like protein crn1 [Acrodontium crateriforme]
MSGRFVRASKYRHVFGRPTRREQCYDNLRISKNAWDTNLIKANPKYLAVNWEASGGGAFAVIPLEEKGKLPELIPLFRGHTAAVLDTDWSPFHDDIIASGSDDGKVFLWKVPEDFTLQTDAEEPADVKPVGKLSGHSRKVGHVLFNPAAENVLASSSGDYTIKLWDLEDGKSKHTLKHNDIVQSLSWSADGNMMVTTSRDKKLRFWDVRQEQPAHEVAGHSGAKNSRCVWLGDHDRVVTTGFSKMSERQLGLWDLRDPSTPVGGDFTPLDSSSGVGMPFWDDGCQMLYLAGKGDGNIKYFEYEHDKFEPLSEHRSPEPQRGLAFMPKRGVNTHENEVMRAYKTVNDQWIEPISFIVPRRAEVFQDDIYPPTVGLKPAATSGEWFNGKTGLPPKFSMEDMYEGNEPVEVATKSLPKSTPTFSAPSPTPASPIKPQPKAEEPKPSTPTPTLAREMPSVKANQKSMSDMASKFADKDGEQDNDDDDASSFEEIAKPVERPSVVAAAARQEAKVGNNDSKSTDLPFSSPSKSNVAASAPVVETKTSSSNISTNNNTSNTNSSGNSYGSGSGSGSGNGNGNGSTSRPTSSPNDDPPQPSSSTPSSTPASAAGGLRDVLHDIRTMIQSQSEQIQSLTREVAALKAKIVE